MYSILLFISLFLYNPAPLALDCLQARKQAVRINGMLKDDDALLEYAHKVKRTKSAKELTDMLKALGLRFSGRRHGEGGKEERLILAFRTRRFNEIVAEEAGEEGSGDGEEEEEEEEEEGHENVPDEGERAAAGAAVAAALLAVSGASAPAETPAVVMAAAAKAAAGAVRELVPGFGERDAAGQFTGRALQTNVESLIKVCQ